MKEQNIIKQLNSLKEIKADAGWKARNREILINQIGGYKIEVEASKNDWIFYFKLPAMMAREISQPTLVAFLIFIFLAGGTVASVRVAENTKPGDSLYVAKIASEKAQFAFTFDQKEKAKLGIVFANNRVKEIGQVLAEPNGSQNGSQNERVGVILNDLKQQISDVKTRIAKINPDKAVVTEKEKMEDGSEIFSAAFDKESQGVQISPSGATDNSVAPVSVATKTESRISTSTETPATVSTTTDGNLQAKNISNTATILKEAEQLLKEEKYVDTLIKLNEADKAVSQVDQGEVKGASEVATSTTK